MLSELLISSKHLERLDIRNNLIDAQGAYCLAQGLALSQSIEFMNIENNPIGGEGRQSLMRARN